LNQVSGYDKWRRMIQPSLNDDILEQIQRDTFAYFQHQTNPVNGLIFNQTEERAPASIAVVGFRNG